MSENNNSNTSGSNLDISQVEDADLDQLASRIESFYKQDSTLKTRLAYHWDRNHKFLDGDQWLVFDGDRETGGLWKRLAVSKANEYIPRPVTNYIFDAYQTLKSYLIKNKPRSTVRPNTQLYRDKTAAKIAELCIEANWARLHEPENYEYAAACLITYGTVFKKDYWDPTSITMAKVPRMQQVPQTDPQTGQVTGMSEQPEIDPTTGEPVYDEIPIGDVNSDIVEPYRIALDPQANDIHKIRWILEYNIQTLDQIKETYGKDGEGYTGKVEDVKEERQLSSVMRRWYNLKTSSGIKGSGSLLEGATGNNGDSNITNSAVVKEYYERPSSQHPRGRMVIVANNVTLYSGESPYTGTELGDWHPYSECRWEITPGRFWGKSAFDSACDIQKQINSIDAVIILTRKTMAIPQKLIPNTAGIAPGTWTGRPGQEIPYREGAQKPETILAAGVDPTVFQERQQRVEDLKNTTGAVDILKGDRPPGVTAASALNMLFEIGTGKLFPVLDRWKRFVENSQKKQLKTICKMYKEPREEFIALLRGKNQEISEQAINRFIGQDLYDNCNVIVEAGSNVPKLMSAKQAQLQEAAQTGTLALEQPANRLEYNRQMGITGFDNDIEPDIKRAEWENDLLDNIEHSPDQAPIVLQVDDDTVHMNVLARSMKEPNFISKSAAVQQAYMQHFMAHQQQQSQKIQEQQMAAMASGQPAGPPENANAPQPVKSHGKGPTKEVRNSLKQDALTPGGQGQ